MIVEPSSSNVVCRITNYHHQQGALGSYRRSDMSSVSIFRLLLKFRIYAGLFSIESTNKPKVLMYSYLIGLFVVFFVQIFLQIFVIAFRLSLGDGSDSACVVAMFSENCIIIVFNLKRGFRSEENHKRTITVVDSILQFSRVEESTSWLKKYSRAFNGLVAFYATNITLIQVTQLIIKGLSFIKVVDLVPDHYLWIYAMPWPTNWITYWPTLALEGLSTWLMIIIQQVNIYYMTSMILLQTLGMEHLRRSLADVVRPRDADYLRAETLKLEKPYYSRAHYEYDHEMDQNNRLNAWVQLHSELINLCNEFVTIYTPLFLSYFLVVFGILLTAVFALMENANFFGVAESILLTLYFSGVMFNLFILSVAGSNLTFESCRVFDEAFHEPWYSCSPRVQSTLKVVGEVVKHPVVITPFRLEHFSLSLHTFIWVMRAMVSVYIGLAGVKRRAEEAGTL